MAGPPDPISKGGEAGDGMAPSIDENDRVPTRCPSLRVPVKVSVITSLVASFSSALQLKVRYHEMMNHSSEQTATWALVGARWSSLSESGDTICDESEEWGCRTGLAEVKDGARTPGQTRNQAGHLRSHGYYANDANGHDLECPY